MLLVGWRQLEKAAHTIVSHTSIPTDFVFRLNPPPFLDNVQKIDTFSSSDVFPKVNGKKKLFQGYMFQSPEPLEEEHLTCLEAVCQGLTSLQLLQLSCVPEGGLFCRSEL